MLWGADGYYRLVYLLPFALAKTDDSIKLQVKDFLFSYVHSNVHSKQIWKEIAMRRI